MKIILFFLLFFITVDSFHLTFAQKNNPVKGFIYTLSGDTIECEFEKQNWKKQVYDIKIRISGKDSTIYPSGISGFINSYGHEFVSKRIELYKYNREIQTSAPGEIPFSETIPSAFLKVLHRGKMNLYVFVDKLGKNHFFIERNSIVKEIYNHLFSDIGGFSTSTLNSHARKPVVRNSYQFVYALKTEMMDCKDLFPVIDLTELTSRSLISLMIKYDKCFAAEK